MTQTLQRIDILIENGSGLLMFIWLSVLIIPSLLSVIIPFALFGAALYALHRLHTDSEIAVMFAAGVGRWRIAAPLLGMTVAAAGIVFWVNLDLMPHSYRLLKQEVADIRADFASSVLRAGQFTSLSDGFTVYVDQVSPGGQLTGLLINDYRDKEKGKVYMAQRGLLRETSSGPILFLSNGNIQRIAKNTGEPDFVRFEETAVNISDFNNKRGELQLELTERYLSELFNPDLSNPWDRRNAGELIAEGHNRLASPLYAFAYIFLALYALVGGAYSRRGYTIRIALACAAAGALRISGFVTQGFAAQTAQNWLQYAIPIGATIILAALLSHSGRAIYGALPSKGGA